VDVIFWAEPLSLSLSRLAPPLKLWRHAVAVLRTSRLEIRIQMGIVNIRKDGGNVARFFSIVATSETMTACTNGVVSFRA